MEEDGRVERVERYSGSPEEWDGFGRGHGGWTHFHRLGWREVIRDVFGHECVYLSARNEQGELTGILPLVRVKSLIFGHYLVSMPFVNYGGPLGTDRAVRALADAAVREAQSSGADLLELRSREPLDLSLPASHRRITVVLPLPEEAEVLWKDFQGKVRNQVRKPRKEGVEIRFGPEQLDGFYAVFAEHMRDLGTPAQPRELFAAIRERFPEDIWFGCAYLDGRPIACGCGLRWEDEFEMTWASALMEYRTVAANMLLYWSFMERCIEAGVRRFNFGRCAPDSGTHRFKKQWGGEDEELWWYQHASDGKTATPSPEDSAYSWGPAIWQRLPVGVTRTLGPRIVQYIP